jgi:hypothetical protein
MPNGAGVQKQEENGETRGQESGDWRMETHKPGQRLVIRIILKMFHVKHFCPVTAQNLTSRQQRLLPTL